MYINKKRQENIYSYYIKKGDKMRSKGNKTIVANFILILNVLTQHGNISNMCLDSHLIITLTRSVNEDKLMMETKSVHIYF